MKWKTVLFASGSALLCGGVAYNFLKKTEMFKRFEKQCESAINEILFYGDDVENRKKQTGLANLSCIYYVIVHANRSIEVCMPSLISDTIAKCLLDVQQKSDVKIRVVLYKTEHFDQVLLLAGNGIEVKVVDDKLDHEFILVDAAEGLGHAVAVVGSLDYDANRVNYARDNTLLTSDAIVVSAFKKEFDRIWDSAICNIEDVVEIDDSE